jgi:multidrug efflux system membrane fusion protein
MLWPNEFVKARLHLSTEKDAVVVPAVAVQRGPKGTFIYVVGPDKTAVMKPIKVASLQGDTAILKEGVEVGEKVVTDGQNQLKPGSRVQERAPDAKPASSASSSQPDVAPPVPASSGGAPAGSARAP